MSETKVIRVDPDVYDRIESCRRSRETQCDSLRRLLGMPPRKRRPSGRRKAVAA